jgi:ATP-dependent DNA helicase DinG
LVRRRDDRGVFVMLDQALPSPLKSALPEGVRVQRIGLAVLIAETASFLDTKTRARH